MAKWVKFSDRLPTEDDLDDAEGLFLSDGNGRHYSTNSGWLAYSSYYDDWLWLEDVPPLPKPRTLEDVARDLCSTGFDFNWHILTAEVRRLVNEMKEILEKGLDNQDS